MPTSNSAVPLRRLFCTSSAAARATLKPPRTTIAPLDVRSTASLGVLQPPRLSHPFGGVAEVRDAAEVTREHYEKATSPGVVRDVSGEQETDDVEATVERCLARVDSEGDGFTTPQCMTILKELTSTADVAEAATRNMLSDGRLQHLVNRTVSVATAEGSSLEWTDVLDLMEAFVTLRLRAPLRDVTPLCFRFMNIPEDSTVDPKEMERKLNYAGRTLQLLGQGMVYHPEVFDFTCHSVARAKLMDPHTMAVVLYEAGRHGLRTKHYTDVIVAAAAELAPGMSLDDLRLSMRGLMRFVKDWRAFFDVICVKTTRVKDELPSMTNETLIMLMRVGKELRGSRQYNEIQKEVAGEISKRLSRREFSSIEQGMVSMYMDKDSRYPPAVYDLAYAIQKDLARQVAESCSDVSVGVRELLSVTDIVDLMDCWASWNLPVEHRLWGSLLNDLALCRLSEIKYSPNISLWSGVTLSCSRVNYYHSTWMAMVCDIGRDPFMLDKISFWQTGQFLAAVSRLNLFDEKLYSNVADVITKDMNLYKDPETLASTLWAMAKSGFVQENFVTAALASANSMVNSTNNNMNAWSQILWSLLQQGCHPSTDPQMASIVDFVSKLPVPAHRGHFRRLHQAADVLGEGSPMQKYLTHPLSSATALPPRDNRRNQISNQIAKCLSESSLLPGRAVDTRVIVSPTCSSILDVAIGAEGSSSAATPVTGLIVAAGETDHRQMRVVPASPEGSIGYYGGYGMKVEPHADHEFEHILTGQNLMYQRILGRRGLRVAIVGEREWTKVQQSGEEVVLLRKKLEEVGLA
ncbi:hypothetical protein FOZ62_032121 [Perkinsus olseni]|uniref:RAP domain-containing protein n=1 Tax=Perkinsus olseni TaxID=32597 RepID=A0A7J6PEC4_PEROL|nr:hypothetical protein FOZ62_032121 [Perkinsus olseni]